MDDDAALGSLLRSLRVWDPARTTLPRFDTHAAPERPLDLFVRWFAEAAEAGQQEPHTPSLATSDDDGLPDVRTVMLHGAGERGWTFASHASSAKGAQLAARPYAALGFYWPALGRQVRVRGPVTTAPPEESAADLRAHSTGALASALTGHQSEVLPAPETLARASEAAWERAEREPEAAVPSWTLYVLAADEVEFFQGDARRRHVRLRYRRVPTGAREDSLAATGTVTRTVTGTVTASGWTRELLWP
ncbi:pyridoxine/pyridoxamine 5'-phosphate oxidase [Streptomyces tsukubensis]|uniref:Oxidase n=1 Tax=Streptomyces tsukubensis TaxID=83656 RepID=A0A1V4A0H3_9ACTN|nr:pyridoxal 5'-phosphate synthase [Streptomyces tsukubensis]OON72231.1 oxidase [Streptomyces tsukubensis]QFR94126.1 pyridoxal 5'-phosphate synthase [Streptomyces tsukubensis]